MIFELIQKIDDAGARVKTTDDIIHTPKFSRILKIWQGNSEKNENFSDFSGNLQNSVICVTLPHPR
jgi:hypothetical protein